ncbi:MAG: sugar ABC transporter ATP-binding protein, partial [Actinomycetota bacterium]|nr:sugar ABC transporter ATP-binding protein [Actinomycetota bacterium]
LRYVAQTREQGLGVIFITHNIHHAYPIGDRFTVLSQGRSLGTFEKDEVSMGELEKLMAGGAELEELEAELQGGTQTEPEASANETGDSEVR